MSEEWRPVPEFPDYSVSNTGLVRTKGGKIKATWPDIKGYAKVKLWLGRKSANRSVHRLVAEAFIGPIPGDMVVCHNNGINSDNRLSNLRIATRSENEADKDTHGTKVIGSKHHSNKLHPAQVGEIRSRYKKGSKDQNLYTLGREFGIAPNVVRQIVTRQIWKHLP